MNQPFEFIGAQLDKTDKIHLIHTNYKINANEASILSNNLKFLPTPKLLKKDKLEETIKNSMDTYARKIRLDFHFRNQARNKKMPFIAPNKFYQPPKADSLTEMKIKEVGTKILEIATRPIKQKRNLSTNEIKALNNLGKNNQIVIKPADKNLGIAIIDKEFYLEQSKLQLQNCSKIKEKYLKYCEPDFLRRLFLNDAETIVKRENVKMNSVKTKQFNFIFDVEETDWNHFYTLPKIHKPKLGWRPIVAAHSSPFRNFADYISKWLLPYTQTFEEYIRDSDDLLSKLNIWENSHKKQKEQVRILSGDVEALYPNINLFKLIDFLEEDFEIIQKHAKEVPLFSKKLIIMGVHSMLFKNYILFDNQCYQQNDGLAMGNNASVELANFYMHRMYEPKQTGKTKILFFARYIDDFLLLVTPDAPKYKTKEEIGKEIMEDLNLGINFADITRTTINWEIQETKRFLTEHVIKFAKITLTMHETSLETSAIFLDLRITCLWEKERIYIKYKPYQKPINKYNYIGFGSFHKTNTQKAWITAEISRYSRRSSKKKYYIEIVKEFYRRLIRKGFPTTFLNKIFYKTNRIWEGRFDEKKKKILTDKTLILPLLQETRISTINSTVKSITKEDVYTRNTIVGFRNPKSIGKTLIRANTSKELIKKLEEDEARENPSKKTKR